MIKVKIKCQKCGLSVTKETVLDAMKVLSSLGCTFAIGYRTWCRCGARDSFEIKEVESLSDEEHKRFFSGVTGVMRNSDGSPCR